MVRAMIFRKIGAKKKKRKKRLHTRPAKVRYLDLAIEADEKVLGLEVAVNDVLLVAVL